MNALNLEKLLEQIKDINIQVSVDSEGVYTACSSNEPKFCFDGYSQAEVADRVTSAIESYAKIYFGLEGFKIRSSRVDTPEPVVRLEAPRPVSRIALEAA